MLLASASVPHLRIVCSQDLHTTIHLKASHRVSALGSILWTYKNNKAMLAQSTRRTIEALMLTSGGKGNVSQQGCCAAMS